MNQSTAIRATAREPQPCQSHMGDHRIATLVGAAVMLAAVGALAGWLPARRASRIDLAEVLRDS